MTDAVAALYHRALPKWSMGQIKKLIKDPKVDTICLMRPVPDAAGEDPEEEHEPPPRGQKATPPEEEECEPDSEPDGKGGRLAGPAALGLSLWLSSRIG